MHSDNETSLKYYNYCLGTEYYLANKWKNAVTYDISYDGSEFTFSPGEKIYGMKMVPWKEKSLLGGIVKIMATWAIYASAKTRDNNFEDERFRLSKKQALNGGYVSADVTMYIDYTNNMILDKEEDQNYAPLYKYIFPNTRKPEYGGWSANEWLPKQLMKINLSDDLSPVTCKYNILDDLYKKYLDALKENKDILEKLQCLKIREQIDIPTKFVVYGVCNKFGNDRKDQLGLVGILYVEHKIPLQDFYKFKELCNEELDEYLKPFNKTYNDILEMTKEKAAEEFDTFEKIDKFARACGYLRDPRKLTVKYEYLSSPRIYDYVFGDDDKYSDESGLARWEGIKKFYPELYRGLKIILDRYIELKTEYSKNIKSQYDEKFKEIVNKRKEELMSSTDENFHEHKYLIIRYIQKYIDNLEPIKMDDFDDIFYTFRIFYQDIMDQISEIYTKRYRQKILEYSYEHPRANKMEFTCDDDIFKGYDTKLQYLLEIQPFITLPNNIKKILNQPKLSNLRSSLNNFKYYAFPHIQFYVNGKKVDIRYNAAKETVYKINDLKQAIQNLTVTFEQTGVNESDYYMHIKDWLKNNNKDAVQISQNEYLKTIHAILSSPIKFKLIWTEHSFNNKPMLYEPIHDKGPKDYNEFNIKSNKWAYDSEKSFDDIITSTELNSETVEENIYFNIVCEYENPQIIEENIKKLECYKEANEKLTV